MRQESGWVILLCTERKSYNNEIFPLTDVISRICTSCRIIINRHLITVITLFIKVCCYGLNERVSSVRLPAGLGIFLFTTASRTTLGPTQPRMQWVTGTLSLEVKRPGCEADHSPPSSAEVKNAWSYNSTLQYTFIAWYLVKLFYIDLIRYKFVSLMLSPVPLIYNTVISWSRVLAIG
jgi:hypothetical protein